MKKCRLISGGLAVALAVVAMGVAMSAQDKYTLTVPNGLAFAEFKGYEDWPVIALSQNGGLIAVILGNPVMIDAYKAGVPGNGQPFPDGAKDGEDPLEPDHERNGSRSADSARDPA